MTDDTTQAAPTLIPRAEAPPPGTFALPPAQAEPDRVNLVALIHRNLRGRYLWAILLSGLGAVAGGAAGLLLAQPKFRAEGLIRVQPVIPKILYQNEESSLQPMFTSFVSTQANLLQQTRVLSKAMSSKPWRDLGRGSDPTEEDRFRKALTVTTNRDAPELIFVSFADPDAKAAQTAVDEVLRAYDDIYSGKDNREIRQTQLQTLDERRKTILKSRDDAQKKIDEQIEAFPTPDLARLSEVFLAQYTIFKDRISQIELRLTELGVDVQALAKQAPNPNAPDQASPPRPQEPPKTEPAPELQPSSTAEQIAAVDRTMADLLAARDRIRRELDRARGSGLTEQHRQIQLLRKQLLAADADIAERVANWKPTADAKGEAGDAVLSVEQLKERYLRLLTAAKVWETEAQRVSKARQAIEGYNREIKVQETLLEEVNHRLDVINVESKIQDQVGRIEIIYPTTPTIPRDNPRTKYTALGIFAGGGFPLAVFLLIGALDRRFRYADQAESRRGFAPMLGILPHLPANPSDPRYAQQSTDAVHCVHHIRTKLQLGDRPRKVYTITSPTSGDGKTSLSLSLALSFVSAGNRTLLVDFDLIGHALTRQVGASCDRGVGFYLIKPDGPPPVAPTRIPGLSIIAAGRQDSTCHSRMARKPFEAMIDAVRGDFDIVIIDTGPVLGSLEAALAATVADGVVLVIGRGQDGQRVETTLQQLATLGADVVGLVFNRAHAADFNRSTLISASFRSVRPDDAPAPPPPRPPEPDGFAQQDPLARSMVQDLRDEHHHAP
jgi:capsular exopolysaccharide synthesis family protein